MGWTKVWLPHESNPWYYGSFGRRAGVLLIGQVALVSFISVLSLLAVVGRRIYLRRKLMRAGRTPKDANPIQPVAILFILAMFMELIQSFALMLSARWPILGTTIEGRYCTAQGALYQLGVTGSAIFTAEIAIMTLLAVTQPTWVFAHDRKLLIIMIAFALVFVPLMVALPSAGIDSMHYGSTGAWCWINVPSSFRGSRVPIAIMRALSDYVWVWGASLICFICYGYIVFRWWWQAERAIGRVKDALVLLWYPVAYFIEIFPQTVINFAVTTAALRHATGHPHPAFFVVSNILFASSGWINVLLWVWTGRQFGFTDESARAVGADEEAEVSVPLTQRGSTRAPAGAAGGNQTDGTRTPREGISLHSHSASSSSFMSSTASSSFQPRHTRNLSSTDSGGGGGGYNDPYENTSYDPYAYAYPTSATSASHPHSFPNTHNDNDSSPSHSLSPPTTRKPLNSPTTRNSNSPYSYPGPSFPGDDNFESPEHAELARTVPDYGGEEFWRQTPSDPDPVLGNVGTSANASTSTHTAGATVGGRPTSAAFGGKAFPLRRQTAGHIQTPISAERDEWGVEGGLR